jgi:AAA domain
MEAIRSKLTQELELIWQAHQAVGLDGFMCVYTMPEQDPWRSHVAGQSFWFTKNETQDAITALLKLYNDGNLPNSTMLLNPIIHHKNEQGTYVPVGSGIFWATAFALGILQLTPDQIQRPLEKGVLCSHFYRGDNHLAGIKMLGISDKVLPVEEGGITVLGCRELYDLTNVKSEMYAPYYVLSGLNYLCLHGIFNHPEIDTMLLEGEITNVEIVRSNQIDVQNVLNATQCFLSYDRLHTLYKHFGQDTADIPHNNRFFNLCARDLDLFDRTGPMRIGSDESFEFIVPGLIPRGAVTLLAASGGTGKSSAAHQLCVLASIDWRDDEEPPKWLGQPINKTLCDGICVYFSGEDGPGIINARGELFDPEGRAMRLQFHRTEFQDQDISFSEYLLRLRKMPKVSIVVIDPARKYLSGDEEDSDVVSEFFEAIEEFAISKQCGMIVVHHLKKGARPTNAREVLDELRGSQVFIDRARVVLGMCRDDKHTIVGLSKCNIPPNLGMITEERIFTRNPENLQLIWLPGKAGVRRDYLTKEEIEALEYEQFMAELAEGKASSAEKPSNDGS